MLVSGPAFAAVSAYEIVVAARAVMVFWPELKSALVLWTQTTLPTWRPWSVTPEGSVRVRVSTFDVRLALAAFRVRTWTIVAVPPPSTAVAAWPRFVVLRTVGDRKDPEASLMVTSVLSAAIVVVTVRAVFGATGLPKRARAVSPSGPSR